MDMRASAMQVDGQDAALEVRAALCVGIPWREAMARTLRERGECGIRAGRASNGGWPAANETAAQGSSASTLRRGCSQATSRPSSTVAIVPSTSCLKSEEHKYELQSLMRISYAVLRLHKK